MQNAIPKFNKPPIVETVLGAQFARLLEYRTAHAGSFWKSSLGGEWTKVEETIRIDDQFERFGDERKWGPIGFLRISPPSEAQRTQISRADGTRMIQLQDSRFIYNWKKSKDDERYPSYTITKQEFGQYYKAFRDFVQSSKLGNISENQWEVTYINHLVKGELWNSPNDWQGIFPWLKFPSPNYSEVDAVISNWTSVLPGKKGRLNISLSYGKISTDGPEALILNLTARGLASDKPNESAEAGFEIGHEVIVRSFTDMTSAYAHDKWQRTI